MSQTLLVEIRQAVNEAQPRGKILTENPLISFLHRNILWAWVIGWSVLCSRTCRKFDSLPQMYFDNINFCYFFHWNTFVVECQIFYNFGDIERSTLMGKCVYLKQNLSLLKKISAYTVVSRWCISYFVHNILA